MCLCVCVCARLCSFVRVCVLGSGNIGRNTTIVRANYFLPGNSEFYSHSLKLWEKLEGELNYNVMHSQRGHIILFHSDGQ